MRRVGSQIAAAFRDSSVNKITPFRERYFYILGSRRKRELYLW